MGLSFLLKLYNLAGRQKDAAHVRDRIEVGLDAINQRGHAWERQLFDASIPQDDVQTSSTTILAQDDAEPPAYQLEQTSNKA